MSHQAILYDPATGMIRQVLDPEDDTSAEDVVKLLKPEPHEAVIAYEKKPGQNRLHEWQLHVSRACGKVPEGLHPEIAAHVKANL